MKRENISDIISDMDDSFIEEAADVKQKNKRIFRYMSAAACLALAVIAGVLLSRSGFVTSPTVGTQTTNESGMGDKNVPEIATSPAILYEGETEIAFVSQWADRTTGEKYTSLMLNGAEYSTMNTVISEDYIGSFVTASTVTGYDIYSDKTYSVTSETYSIKNISADCAVAVKIGDENAYYVYVNVWYEPDTLGDFITDLDLKNTVVFRKAYIDRYEYTKLTTEHTQRVYADFDDSVIWDMLADVSEAENTEYNQPYDRISVETDLPVLGYKNISFAVTPDGYIITNILNTQKCFFIGTQKYEAFAEYLEVNIPFKEYSTVYELNRDGTVPGKGEEVTTPPYIPGETATVSSADTVQEKNNTASKDITPMPGGIVEETTKS